tara:strand:+ start:127 stop:486 length:360 start_codon:yes stop_codon:yes gene_type:complete
MSVIFKLNDGIIIGMLSNKKFISDFTQKEWDRLEQDDEAYGDDGTNFKNLKELSVYLNNKITVWVWATAHSLNERARALEGSRLYNRDDYIGDMMFEQAEYLRERAKVAVKDSLKLIRS